MSIDKIKDGIEFTKENRIETAVDMYIKDAMGKFPDNSPEMIKFLGKKCEVLRNSALEPDIIKNPNSIAGAFPHFTAKDLITIADKIEAQVNEIVSEN